ncbi:aminoglycoside N(3)-acetyltransferase [Bacillus hwajinpoensis]|uniref:Aminoglycoside N(3)-acetyltransferase n=1 Tax=Guptibacillus hwajinpoensis TaxID=208199 RepID=A0A845F246_9BACL|nr:AAC(3) family N-acetyltransferase [Pseudalkalibacillus hwajinpoensis]MYL64804.1 aminoglycoside N(3)-acetyltransferase [Pseudalkalibacillus hwajinpoensis]
MTEKKAIHTVCIPHTVSSLVADFRELGIKEGMTLIVHTSLSSLGWVCGGAEAVIQALMEAVGEEGTLVMPAQTAGNSDPSEWMAPPVPESWWPVIREHMPPFSLETTATRGMGAIAELFRQFPRVVRSNHPMYSFTAWGKNREYVTEHQLLQAGFGETSPLAKIYELNGKILFLGVGHESNTSLHLSEHAKKNQVYVTKSAALLENGERVWKTYNEIDYDSECFEKIGYEFERIENYQTMKIGGAVCKLFDQRKVVDFGRKWYAEHF